MNKIKDFLKSKECQFGFKEGHSTVLCSSVLHQTVQYYLNGGSSVYALFLDASKAFDRVRYDKLFDELMTRNICPLFVRLLLTMYQLNNGIAKWKDKSSDMFKIQNGVKQGSVISPHLFAIYLDTLLVEINRSKVGCYVGDQACNILAFADDIV